MAATPNVPRRAEFRKFNKTIKPVTEATANTPELIVPRYGVVILFGFNTQIKVERGHLVLQDGIGAARREAHFPRVGHGLQRLVVIGADGFVSLAALRWLAADQGAAFVMLERNGTVLATTGPVAASDARLRRAQACAYHSAAAVPITCELISQKLAAQEKVSRDKLHDAQAADDIARFREQLAPARTVRDVRLIESQGSSAYWSAWRKLTIDFPKSDLKKIPDHWKTFGSRTSPVSHGARNAANPANAMLNLLYTVLEAETRLTIAALGLDPGLGLLHIDSATRDSLACDLMEPIRPSVDAFLIDSIRRSPLKREWFFELRDGTCRLMPALVSRLVETALKWRSEVAPIAEWFAQAVCSTSPDSTLRGPRTRLTRRLWRESMHRDALTPETRVPEPQSVCRRCGAAVSQRRSHCKACGVAVSTEALVKGAHAGRIAALTPEALARRKASSQRQNEALQAWNPAEHPSWLTSDYYMTNIQPRLAQLTRPAIAETIGVSVVYAGEIRNGKCIPHMRHWLALAQLAGVSPANRSDQRGKSCPSC
jgi:CRISPR-associated endonuclease Cas1